MRRPPATTLAAALLASAALLAATPGPAGAETQRAARAAVADREAARVHVVDLLSGAVLHTAATESPARLWRAPPPGGGAVALVQSAAGVVAVLDLGVAAEPHGDHTDLRLADPALRPGAVARGPRPSHAVLSGDDGRLGVFFDGDGSVAVVEGEAVSPAAPADAPHHGAAVPFRDRDGTPMLAVSHAPAEREPPRGLELRRAGDGRAVARTEDCPRLHGEGRTGPVLAFGCADGVLLLDAPSASFRKLAYPAGEGAAGSGRMVRNLVGGRDWRLLVGDFGPDALAVVDPDADGGAGRLAVAALPGRRLHFAMDPDRAEHAFALTEDGTLHRVSTVEARVVASSPAPLVGRYPLDAGSSPVRPRLSAAGGLVAITDPARGRLLVADADTLAVVREVALGGAPWDVMAVAAGGERH